MSLNEGLVIQRTLASIIGYCDPLIELINIKTKIYYQLIESELELVVEVHLRYDALRCFIHFIVMLVVLLHSCYVGFYACLIYLSLPK